MIGYKGFNNEFKCLGYQYEIGKTFQIDSNKKLTICPSDINTEAGLHFCINPLNVLNYYGNVNGNRFAVVESIGDVLTHPNDTKVATNKLKVIREITYDELVQLGIEYSIKNTINIEIGWNISHKIFEWCPETLKEKYVSNRIEKNWGISNEQFEWCSETLKEKYILKRIKNGESISDKKLEWCRDELKEKYILWCIENGWYISDIRFELCSDELKEKYILTCIKNGRNISDIMKNWYENFKNK